MDSGTGEKIMGSYVKLLDVQVFKRYHKHPQKQ